MLFSGKKSDKALRRRAENLVLAAGKVYRYRGDLFSKEEQQRFSADLEAVKNALQDPNVESGLGEKADALAATLATLGGTLFPVKKIPEWVEIIVVAAILAGGIRAFFIQPFKIPTNSMFPTYNGMTAEICTGKESFLEKWGERIFRSASFYDVVSPSDGEVLIPLRRESSSQGYVLFPPESASGTNPLSPGQEVHRLVVGGSIVPVAVPRDFSFSSILQKAFFPESEKMEIPEVARWREIFRNAEVTFLPDGTPVLRTGKFVKRGEKILDFKILGGDMVLVERFSYHFFEPELGDPFVFRTWNIPGLNYIEQYYIKRLSGKAEDVLRVSDGKLLLNGAPATFADAVIANNTPKPQEKYYGYLPTSGTPGVHSWPLSRDFRVPGGYFYALGDNSSASYDSRGWGGVPADEVVGSALFILYPFSARWGLAE